MGNVTGVDITIKFFYEQTSTGHERDIVVLIEIDTVWTQVRNLQNLLNWQEVKKLLPKSLLHSLPFSFFLFLFTKISTLFPLDRGIWVTGLRTIEASKNPVQIQILMV